MVRRSLTPAQRAAISAGLQEYWRRRGGRREASVRLAPGVRVRVGRREQGGARSSTLGAAARAYREHRATERTRALNSGIRDDEVNTARGQVRARREAEETARDERLAQAHRRRLSRGQESTPEHEAAAQRDAARQRERRQATQEAARHRRPSLGGPGPQRGSSGQRQGREHPLERQMRTAAGRDRAVRAGFARRTEDGRYELTERGRQRLAGWTPPAGGSGGSQRRTPPTGQRRRSTAGSAGT